MKFIVYIFVAVLAFGVQALELKDSSTSAEDKIIDSLAQRVLDDETAIKKLEETSRKAEPKISQEELFQILKAEGSLNDKLPSNRRAEDLELASGRQDLVDIPNDDSKRCIPKVIQVEEIVYDRGMKCNHSFQEKCHMTFITDYKAAPEKKCDTSYKKNCHITFKPTTVDEKVKICHIPLVRQCGGVTTGPPICSTEYEDVCETVFKTYDIEQDHPHCTMENVVRCNNVAQENTFSPELAAGENSTSIVKEQCEQWPVQKCTLEKKQVSKVHPDTSCKKVPRQVCIPNNCSMVKGPEVCKDDKRAIVQNIPEEECDLQPEEQCRLESSLVPRLIPKPNCIKVPKEICVNTRNNPHKVQRPVIKQWCYDPKEFA